MNSHCRASFKDPANVTIEQNCTEMTGTHEGKLFYGCTFKKLNDLTLKNCDLNQSKFTTDQIEDMLNFTITLNCLSFSNVELSPLIFDMILMLLIKSKGNTEKRKSLISVLGRERVLELLKDMRDHER